MKKLLCVIVLSTLVGCGQLDKVTAQLTGYSKVCIDGVSYIQFSSGATVQYDQTGKVVNCK